MKSQKEQNAVAALIAEYKKALSELENVINDLKAEELIRIADPLTNNPDCKSIQTVLAHVVSSGYSYCVYILNLRNLPVARPVKVLRSTVIEYAKDLNDVLQFTIETFTNITDPELEEFNNEKKIQTAWGQFYDIEQIMEHAIVHILRHRRQIERFKKIIRA
jgi:DinB superfamily